MEKIQRFPEALIDGCNRGLPELISIIATVLLHVWRRQMMLSIAGGTILYMLLVQTVFA